MTHQNSHFGGDGYSELYFKQQVANRDGKPIQNKELSRLKDRDYILKKKTQHCSKLLHPMGAGYRKKRNQI